MIHQLFNQHVIVVEASQISLHDELYPEERPYIRKAVAKRQLEYTTGRLCARQALKQLGIKRHPILVGSCREPLWPDGVTGSISHCDGYCGAVAARQDRFLGIGFDVEPAEPPLQPDIIDLVCREPEKRWLNNQPVSTIGFWAKLLFSAKESTYKCLFPSLQLELDFLDIEISIDMESERFQCQLVSDKVTQPLFRPDQLSGRFRISQNFIFTGATLSR